MICKLAIKKNIKKKTFMYTVHIEILTQNTFCKLLLIAKHNTYKDKICLTQTPVILVACFIHNSFQY